LTHSKVRACFTLREPRAEPSIRELAGSSAGSGPARAPGAPGLGSRALALGARSSRLERAGLQNAERRCCEQRECTRATRGAARARYERTHERSSAWCAFPSSTECKSSRSRWDREREVLCELELGNLPHRPLNRRWNERLRRQSEPACRELCWREREHRRREAEGGRAGRERPCCVCSW